MCQRKTGDFRLDSPTARLKEPHEERAEPATVAGSGRYRRYRVDPESRDDIPAALNALPRKGWLSGPDKERESAEEFVKVRQQHPAVESALNHLKRRGLDRVRTHGKDGFQRTVALAVAAANLDRIGLTGAEPLPTRGLRRQTAGRTASAERDHPVPLPLTGLQRLLSRREKRVRREPRPAITQPQIGVPEKTGFSGKHSLGDTCQVAVVEFALQCALWNEL